MAYKYDCLMIDTPIESNIRYISNSIDTNDIYYGETDEEINSNQYGIEDDPHVTVLYGLHPHENIKDYNKIYEFMMLFNTFTIASYKISSFNNEKYDVLKFDIDSDILHTINGLLTAKFDFTTDYPDYHPHITIAYLKPGTAQKYIDTFSKIYEEVPLTIFCDNFVLSKTNGTKVYYKFSTSYINDSTGYIYIKSDETYKQQIYNTILQPSNLSNDQFSENYKEVLNSPIILTESIVDKQLISIIEGSVPRQVDSEPAQKVFNINRLVELNSYTTDLAYNYAYNILNESGIHDLNTEQLNKLYEYSIVINNYTKNTLLEDNLRLSIIDKENKLVMSFIKESSIKDAIKFLINQIK